MQKRSIHIGVNTFSSAKYPKLPGALTAAEADATAMHELAVAAGLTALLLDGPAATHDAVTGALERAAAALAADDLLVLTFSGHGARFEDTPGPYQRPRPPGGLNRVVADDADGFDECWCLHDDVLIDDELHALLTAFAPGVRIHVLSDSCFSGTILRRSDFPEQLRGGAEVRASVLLSAAAGENEVCFTTELRGRFTGAVLTAWDEGRFAGDLLAFHAAIRALSAPGQVPDLVRYGVRSDAFEHSRPFGAE